MMKLKQLAKRVAAEIRPDDDGERYLFLEREWKMPTSRGLRRATLEELQKLHDRMSCAIPNDFDFWLTFDRGNARAELIYKDGLQNTAGFPFPIPLNAAFVANLRNIDWNDMRLNGINGNQLHEQLVDVADELPTRMPSTAETQERYREIISDYLDHIANEMPELAFLAADEDQLELQQIIVKDRVHLLAELANCMTVGLVIVAIVSMRALLGPEETDAWKQEALEGLGPISRAKAEGRFEEAFRLMTRG